MKKVELGKNRGRQPKQNRIEGVDTKFTGPMDCDFSESMQYRWLPSLAAFVSVHVNKKHINHTELVWNQGHRLHLQDFFFFFLPGKSS